jgi:gliding motility-associated-like protein
LKSSLIILILLLAFYTKAQQNLISNPSFEDTIYCNVGVTDITQIKSWYSPTINSTFVTSYCHNISYFPRTGSVCVGGFTYYFGVGEQYNYYANKFTDTLNPNKVYCFKMFLKLYNKIKYGSNNFAVFIENSHIFYPTTSFLAPATPIATLNTTIIDTIYQEFSFLYNASGGETDFMIGGYMPYSSANYPLIYPTNQYDGSFFVYDDFSMVPTDIDLGPDTTLCTESDSLLLGEPNWTETNYKWYANGVLIDTIHGQIKVKPNNTTSYLVQKETSCITTFDTLLVTNSGACPVLSTDIKNPIIPNVFSPNGDDINEYWKITLPSGSKLNNLVVYNRWGNIVFTTVDTIKPWFGRTTSGEICSEGVYFFVLRYTDAKGEEQKKNGYISLFR